jgi:hypothetical protein
VFITKPSTSVKGHTRFKKVFWALNRRSSTEMFVHRGLFGLSVVCKKVGKMR